MDQEEIEAARRSLFWVHRVSPTPLSSVKKQKQFVGLCHMVIFIEQVANHVYKS